MPITAKDRKKYDIKATTDGYPELELALYKAKEKLTWKGLTAHLVAWCHKNQPKDDGYSLSFWQGETHLNKANKTK